jgi:CRISPR-associated protein (TIGR03986 family)
MKTGKLIKEGKFWKISAEGFANPMPIFGDFGLQESMNGVEIEFDNTGGAVKLIRHEGKDYTKQLTSAPPPVANNPQRGHQNRPQQHKGAYQSGSQNFGGKKLAVAPYNFVPLHTEVVPSEERVDFDSFNETKQRLSGYITLNIVNNSPLFIRGEGEKFFQAKGGLIIQGSSLRGMVRSYVEMASKSKFKPKQHFNDSRFYHRAMADMAKDLRELYKRQIAEGVEAGYLTFDVKSKRYFIKPAEGLERVPISREFTYNRVDDGYEVHTGKMQNKNENWLILDPSDEPAIEISQDLIESYMNDDNKDKKVPDILSFARKRRGGGVEFGNGVPIFFKREKGKILSFGHTRNYRYPYGLSVADHVPAQLQEASFVDMAEAIFGSAGDDKKDILAGRVFFEDTAPLKYDQNSSQLVLLKILGSPKPTTFQHYLIQPNGHKTRHEELAHWETSINPLNQTSEIRGYKQYWHKKDLDITTYVDDNCQIKRGDFVSYLRDVNANVQATLNGLNIVKDGNGIDKIQLRGNLKTYPEALQEHLIKFFNLKQSDYRRLNIAKPQNTLARVLNPNQKLVSRIRFENLTQTELGALLFVLDLPEGCNHKLGMGKPLGLGSVKITPSLTLIQRKERYQEVFADDNDNWASGEVEDGDLQSYKDAFAKYMALQTKQEHVYNDANGYWNKDSRMLDLQLMLRYNQGIDKQDWLDRTRYQRLKDENNKNEFKDRSPLPTPSQVVQKDFYK